MRLLLQNLLAVLISAACCTVLSVVLNTCSSIYSAHWYLGLAFLSLLSFILNLLYAFKAGTSGYTELLMGSIVVRLLAAMSGIALYMFLHPEGFNGFALQFTFHYILFTIFEIRYLLHILRKKLPS